MSPRIRHYSTRDGRDGSRRCSSTTREAPNETVGPRRTRGHGVSLSFINGLPGFVTIDRDGAQTTALEIEGDKIVAIHVMRNPDKLRRLGDQSIH